ncbi:hypothetical protein MASR2M78_27330 [Treponema sp.]
MEKNKEKKPSRAEAMVMSATSSLGASGPTSPKRHYSMTAATAEGLHKKLKGRWTLIDHLVDEEPFIERFAARALKNATLEDAVYSSEYEFKAGLCLKHIKISGIVRNEDGLLDYQYSLRLALSWDFDAPGLIRFLPELGYQCTELGGEPVAVKELDSQEEPTLTAFRFEGSMLVLEEGSDIKRLERLS